MKMKRKDFEERVYDDFSDFSLSTPANKIRRLDLGGGGGFDANQALSGLAPILEEDEEEPVRIHSLPSFEELEHHPHNEERSIVLFKPPSTTAIARFPSGFSVSSDILSGLRNQIWSRQSPYLNSSLGDDELSRNNNCLAVVPWVPVQASGQETASGVEFMDAEDVGEAMEIEEDNNSSVMDGKFSEPDGIMASESLTQWQQQQQHCMTPPQRPQNISTPVVWYQ